MTKRMIAEFQLRDRMGNENRLLIYRGDGEFTYSLASFGGTPFAIGNLGPVKLQRADNGPSDERHIEAVRRELEEKSFVEITRLIASDPDSK